MLLFIFITMTISNVLILMTLMVFQGGAGVILFFIQQSIYLQCQHYFVVCCGGKSSTLTKYKHHLWNFHGEELQKVCLLVSLCIFYCYNIHNKVFSSFRGHCSIHSQ
jgi:hypothetical protein